MALRLVIGACSNEHVAGWALQSMGGDLARQTRREAAREGKPPGRFVAEIVRDFERTSDFAARANAARSMRGADQPLLAGLRFILARRAHA
ncbi:MAG TPA: hypothetical protein VFE63_02325 [Roseiarcus sp.]|jgi:hypothetical protein|nr:hypothetical protein [Roseiarcus sp.]